MNLYDDVGSIKISGYASIFGVTYQHGDMLERVEAGAFDVARFDICACFDHDDRPGRRLAWTRDRSLSVWQDRTGLAFELAIPSSWSALGLIRGIRTGIFRACSFRCGDDDAIKSEVVVERGRPVRLIRRITIDEVSICPAGANPAACCWLPDESVDGMPDHVRQARSLWAAGRLQAQIAARARAPAPPRVKPRPPAAVLAKIDRILAHARPCLPRGRR